MCSWADTAMAKRILRVTKWLAMAPAVGVCTACEKDFKVPMAVLSNSMEARSNLQQQFDQHTCESKGAASAGYCCW